MVYYIVFEDDACRRIVVFVCVTYYVQHNVLIVQYKRPTVCRVPIHNLHTLH